MAWRRLQLVDGTAQKFWNIRVQRNSYIVHFGRLGSQGQKRTTECADSATARERRDRLIQQKLNKGYVEVATEAPSPTRVKAKLPRSSGVRQTRTTTVESIYLVSDKITPVSSRDVDRLEEAIGSLPVGYREFITRFGSQGELCEFMQIWSPEDIQTRAESECARIADDLVALRYKLSPLTRADLNSLWVFGRGNMSTLIYAPRHEGILFNVAHRGAEKEGTLIRHKRGLADPAALFWWGQARHPFPFFVPRTKEIRLKSFVFRSRKPTVEIAEEIGQHWQDGHGPVHRVRMPSCSHEDSVYVFVKGIGGYITINRNSQRGRKSAFGRVFFEKALRKEVNRFVKQFA